MRCKVVDSYVPAAADAEVGAFRNDVYESLVLSSRSFEYCGSAVGGVVVHHDDVIFECGLLRESRTDCVGDGLRAVEHGYDDRCLEREVLLAVVGLGVLRCVYHSTNLVQVLCGSLFHFYLHLAVARIDVVELSLAALA